jgi:aspartokinase
MAGEMTHKRSPGAWLGRIYTYMAQDYLPHPLAHHSDSGSAREVAVVKIGGSILTSAKAYRRAAIFVRDMLKANPIERIVVVVSAQQGATDRLERAAAKIQGEPNSAARDLLWSTGEIRSVALLSLHLESLGVRAAALNIHEAGLILPEGEFRGGREAGRIHLHGGRFSGVLADFPVAVVPGFFATNSASQIVSLGRGGSDLTAVLLAEGLRACRCELIKDVPGYFTTDPHRDSEARHLPFLSFEQAISMAEDGCNLVQRQAIEAAARCGIPLVIRSVKKNASASRIANAPAETEQLECERTAVGASR